MLLVSSHPTNTGGTVFYKDIKFMEEDLDGRKFIFRGIQPGDYTYDGKWKLIVTEDSLTCDCGKGMYCPFVRQEKIV